MIIKLSSKSIKKKKKIQQFVNNYNNFLYNDYFYSLILKLSKKSKI